MLTINKRNMIYFMEVIFLVKAAVNAMISHNIINPAMKRQYEYAIEIMIERFITLGSMLLLSICMGKIVQAIFFMAFFMLLRGHTGGYHAKSFCVCYIESMIVFVLIMIFGDRILSYQIFNYMVLVSSFFLIMIVGTINHPSMNYSDPELRESRKATRYILILESFVILSLKAMGASEQCICFMSWGIILCAISIMIAKITKQEVVR